VIDRRGLYRPTRSLEECFYPVARAVVDRWAGTLAPGPVGRVRLRRFLAAMLLVRVGELREVRREVHNGQALVVLVNEREEELYAVPDPLLDPDNERLVLDELLDELLLLVG
jgi:hypothetical protein